MCQVSRFYHDVRFPQFFFDEFIKTILITDSLNSLNEVQNILFKFTFYLKPKQAFDLLRENMVNEGITILKYDDLFVAAL